MGLAHCHLCPGLRPDPDRVQCHDSCHHRSHSHQAGSAAQHQPSPAGHSTNAGLFARVHVAGLVGTQHDGLPAGRNELPRDVQGWRPAHPHLHDHRHLVNNVLRQSYV